MVWCSSRSHALTGSTSSVPILSGGHFNVTAKNFTKTLAKVKTVLVGFSSRSCHKCIGAEEAYASAAGPLKALKVALARADGESAYFKEALTELNLASLPQLVLYRQGEAPAPYLGVHRGADLVAYARKVRSGAPLCFGVESLAEAAAFLAGSEKGDFF